MPSIIELLSLLGGAIKITRTKGGENRILIIAHRGASAYEPENTFRAIRRAIELGADLVEVDVRESKDGHVVVIHDEKVDRTTNGRGYVKELTLDELKRLDAGLGEKISTLREVIREVKGKIRLVIEIKVQNIEQKVLQLIAEETMKKDAIVVSFYSNVLEKIRGLDGEIKTGFIFSKILQSPLQLAVTLKSNIILPRYSLVSEAMVNDAHKLGLMIIPWTVDNISIAKQLIKLGVNGIATNKPDIRNELLK